MTGVLTGGITFIFVLLLALGTNQVHRCNSKFIKGINLDEVSKLSNEKTSLIKILDNYPSRHKHTLFLYSSPQTLDIWKDTFEKLTRKNL